MADKKKLPPDHPQKRPKRRPKAIRAKWQTCPRCQKRINVNDGTGGIHTCFEDNTLTRCGCGAYLTDAMRPAHTCAYLEDQKAFATVTSVCNTTAGRPAHASYFVDFSKLPPTPFQQPDRRDPFWDQLSADLTLARARFTRWLRTRLATALRSCGKRLLGWAYRITVDA